MWSRPPKHTKIFGSAQFVLIDGQAGRAVSTLVTFHRFAYVIQKGKKKRKEDYMDDPRKTGTAKRKQTGKKKKKGIYPITIPNRLLIIYVPGIIQYTTK